VKEVIDLPFSVGAGTVEFIMDATTDEYFFMEM
jgi:acetyl/propionyl-CoA carboxylase alpha subunit